ncbi:MAG TPA: hypothetical protein VKG02_05040 [Blastocatellia bacterium]|nr:hypothetical protein [Blastocatellia bacterium]
MFRKIVTVVLIAALVNVCALFASAKTPAEKETQRLAKIRAAIQKLGVGEKARVKLKLKDDTKLEGYVSEAGEESFAVTNPETGATTTVTYPQVGQVKGHNLSTGVKIGIGVGVAIAIAVIVLFATNQDEIKFPH